MKKKLVPRYEYMICTYVYNKYHPPLKKLPSFNSFHGFGGEFSFIGKLFETVL